MRSGPAGIGTNRTQLNHKASIQTTRQQGIRGRNARLVSIRHYLAAECRLQAGIVFITFAASNFSLSHLIKMPCCALRAPTRTCVPNSCWRTFVAFFAFFVFFALVVLFPPVFLLFPFLSLFCVVLRCLAQRGLLFILIRVSNNRFRFISAIDSRSPSPPRFLLLLILFCRLFDYLVARFDRFSILIRVSRNHFILVFFLIFRYIFSIFLTGILYCGRLGTKSPSGYVHFYFSRIIS